MLHTIKIEKIHDLNFCIGGGSSDCGEMTEDGVSLDDFQCDLDLFGALDTATTPSTSPREENEVISTEVDGTNKKYGVVKARKKNSIPISTRRLLSALKRAEEQARTMRLIVAPTIDKFDSVIYFPCALARIANGGDIQAFTKLIRAQCHKSCEIVISKRLKLSLTMAQYFGLFNSTITLFSDSVHSVTSTKVIGNTIVSELYYQYTDVPEMHEYAKTFVTDPLLKFIFVGKREDILKRRIPMDNLTEHERSHISSILNTQDEIKFHSKLELILTFEPVSRKITNIQCYTSTTSITHNHINYPL